MASTIQVVRVNSIKGDAKINEEGELVGDYEIDDSDEAIVYVDTSDPFDILNGLEDVKDILHTKPEIKMASQVEDQGTPPDDPEMRALRRALPPSAFSPTEVSTRNVEGGSIQALAEYIERCLGEDEPNNIFDEALGEIYLDDEMEALDEAKMERMRYAFFGRALLYNAEQMLIKTAGLVDD